MQVTISKLRHAFVARLSEWEAACILTLWGVVLLMPSPIFDGGAWVAFRILMPENALGLCCLAGGLVRLSVLAANGAWRPMYYVRAWLALTSFAVWVAIVLGFLSSGQIGTWIAVYPTLALFDAVNVFRAMSDAAFYEKGRRVESRGVTRHAPDPA